MHGSGETVELGNDQRLSLAVSKEGEGFADGRTVEGLAGSARIFEPGHGPSPALGLEADRVTLGVNAVFLIGGRDAHIANYAHENVTESGSKTASAIM